MGFIRLSTANMFARTVNNLANNQASVAGLMENASSGKRVLRASDDPVAAAQVERAKTRMNRTETDQRALDAQVATISYGESTLGAAGSALQSFRDLLVSAGNATYSQTERDALVSQMKALRDQIAGYANRSDTNGLPLFRGLGSAEQPLQGNSFLSQSGQASSGENSIASTLDGTAAFMNVPTGNGVLEVSRDATTTGKVWTDVGQIIDPAAATAVTTPIKIVFAIDAAGATTYSTDGGTTSLPYKSGEAISVAGMNLTITGTPANGDSFTIAPSQRSDIFSVLDKAIAVVSTAGNSDGSTASGSLNHGLAKALTELDSGMNRMQTVRGFAGDLLNRADAITDNLGKRSLQLEDLRSKTEDADMIPLLTKLETQKTVNSAALSAYAQNQKLSLFDYLR